MLERSIRALHKNALALILPSEILFMQWAECISWENNCIGTATEGVKELNVITYMPSAFPHQVFIVIGQKRAVMTFTYYAFYIPHVASFHGLGSQVDELLKLA